MDGMDMGGMDMSSGGMFTTTNMAVARGFWYAIAASIGLLGIRRAINTWEMRQRQKIHQQSPYTVVSRPRGWFSQSWATATAATRELSYAQPVYFTGFISRFFTPLPVGRWLLLALYWIVVLTFLLSGTILKPGDPMYPYKYEKIGFRAAWVSVTQIPLIFLLSCKFNPISLVSGISYERLNWLHRWTARTVFITAIIHWASFFMEWSIADIVAAELEAMTMVTYGFGAWAVISWMILSGFGFFRHMSYEIFVLQHIAAAATLLWLLFMHIPGYALYNVWMSIGFVAFDWGVRIIWGTLQNTHILSGMRSLTPGYTTKLEALPGDVIRLTIEDPDFTWEPGQHAYLVVPTLRPFEAHPFTIANAPPTGASSNRRLSMLIQARRGFSRSLLKAARRQAGGITMRRSFLSGPWGKPPQLSHYDSVVTIACSTGASFIVPLLQKLVEHPGSVRKAAFHWIIRKKEHAIWFRSDLEAIVVAARRLDFNLTVTIHVTERGDSSDAFDEPMNEKSVPTVDVSSTHLLRDNSSTTDQSSFEDEKQTETTSLTASSDAQESTALNKSSTISLRHAGRPYVESFIRPAVESAQGETAVVVCGGTSVTAQSRTLVAALSDERAVHKGTGAQGIFLFTETYGW